MLEIAKTNTQLSNHKHGPHFILESTDHLRETNDGAEVIELPLDRVVAYLSQDPLDPLRIEAMALLCNNSGMQFQVGRWLQGERAITMLFIMHDGRAAEDEGGMRKDGQGKTFISLHTLSVARVLGHKRDFPGQQGSFPKIQQYISEFLAQIGLRPNLERIQGEFCSNCAGAK